MSNYLSLKRKNPVMDTAMLNKLITPSQFVLTTLLWYVELGMWVSYITVVTSGSFNDQCSREMLKIKSIADPTPTIVNTFCLSFIN